MAAIEWDPEIRETDQPKYVQLAVAIGDDIAAGRLKPGDRLPPQRKLAAKLGIDVSLVSRAYSEAVRRGYVASHVGRGTFVNAAQDDEAAPDPRRTLEEDPRMNMPPEIDDPAVVAGMRRGLDQVGASLIPLLRYQSAVGSAHDRDIAVNWLQANSHNVSIETLTIAPGAHAAIHAAISAMRQPGAVILCEPITYPGIRAIASNLALELIGLEEDDKGVTPESLENAISEHPDAILYLNPTLRNPTTETVPADRRVEIAEVLRRHGAPLIEDDAYGLVVTDAPPPISDLIPDLAWRIVGVSKALGAGLRLAYAIAPDREKLAAFVQTLRAINVMTSPLNLALMSAWIESGTADDVRAAVRRSARLRQNIAARALKEFEHQGADEAFNIWLTAPNGLSRAEVLSRAAGGPLAIMPSDAFTVAGTPREQLRVCLGGPMSDSALEDGLFELRSKLRQNDWGG